MEWIAAKEGPQDTGPVTTTGYIGEVPRGEVRAPSDDEVEPQGFSVRMAPGCPVLRTHFHSSDQFQLFTEGSARFANHDIAAGVVHFADRHVPYGPLRAGAEGVTFLTLRSASSAGAHFMPENQEALGTALAEDRAHRAGAGRRNVSFDLSAIAPTTPGVWQDLRADPDELRIAVVDLGATTTAEVGPVRGDGAFLAVLTGWVHSAEGAMGPGAICWCPRDGHGHLAAGVEGARVVLLQFPVRVPDLAATA